MRIIEPIAGMPRITIRFRAAHRYGEPVTSRSSGSNHIRYWRDEVPVRLTTDAPLSYIENEASFVLTRPVHLVFGADEPFEGIARNHLPRILATARAIIGWSGCGGSPFRSTGRTRSSAPAITLKLCNFEETGAIVAALTTSIPEGPGSGRNWDYRFCWMRDAFFVVRALNRIGATRTMEDFISYILTIAAGRAEQLQAALRRRAYRFARGAHRAGARRLSRRRSGAHRQRRGAIRISTTSTAASSWRRRRCSSTAGCPGRAMRRCFRLLEPLGEQAAKLALEPDAGIWEYRGRKRVHTHSAAMCWAGCQRLEAIAAHLGLSDRAAYWGEHRQADRRGGAASAPGIPSARRFRPRSTATISTPAALLLAELGLVAPDDPRFVSTVEAIEQ